MMMVNTPPCQISREPEEKHVPRLPKVNLCQEQIMLFPKWPI